MKKKLIELEEAFYQAETFLVAADAIMREGTNWFFKKSEFTDSLDVAAIVNHAFAFELYLKCILLLEREQWISGHNLFSLFKLITLKNRTEILNKVNNANRDNHEFLAALKEGAEAFIEMRYRFENTNQKEYNLSYAILFVREKLLELQPSLKEKAHSWK